MRLTTFLAKEAARVTGYSREAEGTFIYTDSSIWCDSHGSGTFVGETDADAIKRFYAQVRSASEVSDDSTQ